MPLTPQDELFERARKTIRDLRERLSAAEAKSQREPIAVIGMGIRFPGCGSDLERFWRMLADGRDAVTPVPADRWDADAVYSPKRADPGRANTRQGAFLEDVRRFDAGFFDIAPVEAERMDPQQRLFLETAWHALEHAGISRERIAGTDTGLFVGVHTHSADYQAMQFRDPASLGAYSGSGTAHDMIGGRLAYWLDLHGPSMALNTACSSSLSAVHLACRALNAGECSMAIVGGVNLFLEPVTTIAAAQLELLAGDGRCKTFDARADGMGRGEGCGVVLLKKLSEARQDGDRVLAVIRGSAMNQDGRTNGLIAPNGQAQRRVLRQALASAGVQPAEVTYVETHGTGTALGDPIEVEALTEVLQSPSRTRPCSLGAVKANIGHLEGAAGIAGLIKAVLVLTHRWLPPVANLQKLNPHLPDLGNTLRIPWEGEAWSTEQRRLAGVSSFGWSGTNVHVVLEEAPSASPVVGEEVGALPLLLSAQSSGALGALLLRYAEVLENASDETLREACSVCAGRRTHFRYRFAAPGCDAREVASRLKIAGERLVRDHETDPGEFQAWGSDPGELTPLARRWLAGEEVNWEAMYGRRSFTFDAPLYPFQGDAYWLPEILSSHKAEATPKEWTYTATWVQARAPQLAAELTSTTNVVLIPSSTAPEVKAAKELAYALESLGHATLLWRPEEPSPSAREISYEPLDKALRRLSADPERRNTVVFLAGDESAALQVTRLLLAAQHILASNAPAKLWVLLRSDPADHDVAESTVAMALRAFMRSFGLEHPEIGGGVLLTDRSVSAEDILAAIEQANGEDSVLLTAAGRQVLRLRRQALSSPAAPALRPDRFYLVTGGLGRLGTEVARWLVEHGARHVILIGRRTPSTVGNPALLKLHEDWRGAGVDLRTEALDVANEAGVRDLLETVREQGRPVAGIVHTAAEVRFNSVADATEQEVQQAFHAKVEGARVLDRCSREFALEFFLLFGSGAATLGLRRGAVYAAANACLETIATDRRRCGLRATCIAWGLWQPPEGAGHFDTEQFEQISASGFRPMPARAAATFLNVLVQEQRSSLIVADIDWEVLGAGFEVRGRDRLVVEILEPEEERPTSFVEALRLRGLPAEERRLGMMDLVGAEVRKILGMPPGTALDETRGFFQQGMDSLMSVRLKRALEARLGVRLPGTVTLSYPTITALAEYLEDVVFAKRAVVQPEQTEEDPGADSPDADVEGMSDPEVNLAIAAELAAIQQKFGAA